MTPRVSVTGKNRNDSEFLLVLITVPVKQLHNTSVRPEICGHLKAKEETSPQKIPFRKRSKNILNEVCRT